MVHLYFDQIGGQAITAIRKRLGIINFSTLKFSTFTPELAVTTLQRLEYQYVGYVTVLLLNGFPA